MAGKCYGSTIVSKTTSGGSTPSPVANNAAKMGKPVAWLSHALVTELAYVLVLEAKFCGFDSHRAHQF